MRDHLGSVPAVDSAAHAAERPLIEPVRAHDRRSHDGLGHLREHLAHARPGRVERGRETVLERPHDEDQRHDQRHDRERQLPRVHEHQRERGDDLEARPDPRDPTPLHELLHRVDVGRHSGDEHPALLVGLLGDRQAMDVRERSNPQTHHRALRGSNQPPAGGACRHEGQHDEGEGRRADASHEHRAEPAVEAAVEDELDQHRRGEIRDHDAERDDHREQEPRAELLALADPPAENREGAAELFWDLEVVVANGGFGAHRSPRS